MFTRSMRILLLLIALLISLKALAFTDTVRVSKNEILILRDTIFAPDKDTVYFVDAEKYRVRSNPYKSSQDFYQKMREKTGQNKVTAQLFDLLYVSPNARSERAPSKNSRTSNTPFMPYEGMRIRNIRIKHIDLLEGSVNDTLRQASSPLSIMVNKVHINTWNTVIRNNLLIDKNEEIDPYLMADNERILRRLRFIEDVRIYVRPLPDGYAEVIVAVKDRFSWGTALNITDFDEFNLALFNRNIAGWGKYASATWFFDTQSIPASGYEIRTGGQNIDKAITNWELNHTNIGDRESWGIDLQKEFVAPGIKYGGGLDIRTIRDSTITLDGEESDHQYYHLHYQDFWAGRSFALPSSYERKNLIVAARLLNNSFASRPFVAADSNFLYYNRKLLMGEVSLSSRKFLKSNYIAAFGISEDIPLGYRVSFITGRDFNEFYQQNYLGFQLFWSSYIKNFGYLLLNQEIGAFDRTGINEGVVKIRASYFSPLLSSGRYHIRNFMKMSFTKGIDQPPQETISLEGRIRDIEGERISGNNILALGVESILFTPWYFYGFRFAPFFYYNVGEVWDYRPNQKTSYGYQGAGGGIRIRNESLVFNTLEVRLTHFPKSPPGAKKTVFSLSTSIPISFDNIFKYKPALIPYR